MKGKPYIRDLIFFPIREVQFEILAYWLRIRISDVGTHPTIWSTSIQRSGDSWGIYMPYKILIFDPYNIHVIHSKIYFSFQNREVHGTREAEVNIFSHV